MLILLLNGRLTAVVSGPAPFVAGPYSRPGTTIVAPATELVTLFPIATEVASYQTLAPEAPTVLVLGAGVSSTSLLVGGTTTIQ